MKLPAGPAPHYVPKEHEEALREPKPGFERALVGLWKSLAEYARAHHERYGIFVSEDGYMGEEWSGILSHAHALLNGESGRLDCGTLSQQIEDLRTSGGSPDAVERVEKATAPKAYPKASPSTSPIGTKALTERQRDLLALIRVEDNVAVFSSDEQIPDWSALKEVMVALGGKWRSRKGFVFDDDTDAKEVVRLAYETGEILDPRAAEFFETPKSLADLMASHIDPRPWDIILEPSAGRGALVRAVLDICPSAHVSACEPLPKHRAELEGLGVTLIGSDFMDLDPEKFKKFSCVVMNPPFSRRQDIRHITKAISMLAPDGRLAAIASAGVLYREDRLAKDFRALVEKRRGVIEPNPEGSFKESGTLVSTVLIRI